MNLPDFTSLRQTVFTFQQSSTSPGAVKKDASHTDPTTFTITTGTASITC